MALIKCEECGHMISDKATECPNCGCPIEKKEEKTMVCEECGAEITPDMDECPNCGCPISAKKSIPNEDMHKKSQIYANQRKRLFIISICVFCVIVCGIGLYVRHTITQENQLKAQIAEQAEQTRLQEEAMEKERQRQAEEERQWQAEERQRQAEEERQLREEMENKVRLSKGSGSINGHEYVDLGLSVKWATCNIGASSPSDYGNYYAWGETKTKSEYTKANSITHECQMLKIVGDPEYDAARAIWGGTWRLPTNQEIDEIINKCSHVWVTIDGHNGYKITGPNGNSIFLPAAGCISETTHYDVGKCGRYWNGEFDKSLPSYSCGGELDMMPGYVINSGSFRYVGESIRPVTE